jgi:hypothetical protein
VAAEVDYLAVGHVERAVAAGVSAGPHSDGAMSGLELCLDRFVTFDRADSLAVDADLESTASELESRTFPRQPERC